MRFQNLLFLIFILGFCSCKEIDKSLLHGKWKGDELIEKGVDKGAKEVEFNFFPDGTYSYQNSYYKEAGHFKTVENILYTTDTTQEAHLQIKTRVSHLTLDSLYLEMNEGGKPQLLKCFKVK